MSGGASEEDLDDVDIPEDEYLFEIVERAPASSSLLNVMRETPASGAATDAPQPGTHRQILEAFKNLLGTQDYGYGSSERNFLKAFKNLR